MNEEQIERLLGKAPSPKAPAGLLDTLRRDIRMPHPATNRMTWSSPPSLLKRWLPALSFAAIFLTCLVAIAVQTNVISELTRENADLRATIGNLETLRAENAEYHRLLAENGELDRLRKDNAELAKLRSEVAQLRGQLQEIEKLRAENQQLQAANMADASASGSATNDFFAEEQAKAERIHCVSNLKQIGLAFRLWAGDNGDKYPADFISMTNELGTPILLQCPSDKSHNVTNWAQVAAGDVSYRRVSSGPGVDETHPNIVLFECPIHGSVGLVEGSVQQLSPAKRQQCLKVIDGITYYIPSPP